MRLSIVDTGELTPETAPTWRPGAATVGAGIAFVDGPHIGVVAPTETLAAWTLARYGAGVALVTELAGFVYHRKAWFADDLDPLVLRDRRPGQYELRVFTELDGEPVPLFAMDLAPVRHDGPWSALDQRQSNSAASLLEIAVVAAGQTVAVGGEPCLLDDLDCTGDRIWEASRLASMTELVRAEPRASEVAVPAFARVQRAVDHVRDLDPAIAAAVHDAGRGLFGACLAWTFARLPIDLVIGLSQGRVVEAFTTMVVGGRARPHQPLTIERWHRDAPAFTYAPGYFATGQVCGYAIDARPMVPILLDVGLGRLERAHAAYETTGDVLAGLTRSA